MNATGLLQQRTEDDAPLRRQLSPIFTSGTSRLDSQLNELSEDADREQQLSQQLLGIPTESLPVSSAPEPLMDSFFGPSPSLQSENENGISPSDMSLSPAAMFLSSFSPMMAPTALPDDEGEAVSGYVLGPIVGHGGTSIIRRAASPQGGVVAVKIVRRSDLDKQEDPDRARAQLQHEAAVWSSLNHEHILPLFSFCHTPYADFFIMLYCPAGSLFDIIKRDGRPALPQDEAGRMYRQVVKGLRYMHEVAGYVHGDMKLENVLVDEMGVCRIGDFGMAKRIGEPESDDEDRTSHTKPVRHASVRQRSRSRHPMQHTLPAHPALLHHRSGPRHRNSSPFPTSASNKPHHTYQAGSLPYASPELLIPATSVAPYHAHPAQDVWALGVMLYVMLTGRLPFLDAFEPRLQMKIMNGAFTMPTDIGRGAERVLQGSLEPSVRDRWTIAMVDEVAWGIGWGDAGDETPPPRQMPPSARSRSRPRAPPASTEVQLPPSEGMSSPRRSLSRSRSSRSRSRHVGFHPYLSTEHEWSSGIQRTFSSSTDGDCLSPVDQPEIRTPSSSLDRSSRERLYRTRVASAANSPTDEHAPPIDNLIRDRGRKLSPRVRPPSVAFAESSLSPTQGLHTLPVFSSLEDSMELLSHKSRNPSVDADEYDRQAHPYTNTVRQRSSDRSRKPREISLPPHPDLHQSWLAPTRDGLGFLSPSPRDKLESQRSRSVGHSHTHPS
ncbi:kinase-like protein [Trametopsis cervina]|nr:kinase-like protein [Trametopsis cervina]